MPIQVFWELSASECYEVIFLTKRFNEALTYLPKSQQCFLDFKYSPKTNISKQLYFVTVKNNCTKINKITLFCFSSKARGPQPFWHQGPVSWKTIFPWLGKGGVEGAQAVMPAMIQVVMRAMGSERQMKLHSLALWSPLAVRPSS